MSRKYISTLLFTASLLLFLPALRPGWGAHAQQGLQCSTPQKIPGYGLLNEASNDTYAPFMASDSTGRVHAVNSLWSGNERLIFYNYWTQDQGWSLPIDILFSPQGQARIQGESIDQFGNLHLVFWGGDDVAADIYYSHSIGFDFASSKSWSPPKIIAKNAIAPSDAVLVSNGAGYLAVLYSGNTEGNGLYSLFSTDNGATWSEPVSFFLTNSAKLWPYGLNTFLDEDQQLHTVWTVVNEAGNGEAVYYARLHTLTGRWEEPIVLDKAVGYEADWAAIVSYQGQLIVVYNNGFPATRFMKISTDNGVTWSSAARLFPHIGEYRFPALVIDAYNGLHMFLGNRIGQPAVHGMWHSEWVGGRWTNLDPIISGRPVIAPPGENGFDPNAPVAVSVGNGLLVAWRTDPAAGPNGVWFSYCDLQSANGRPANTPASPTAEILPVAPTPTTPAPTQTLQPTIMPTVNPTLAAIPDSSQRPGPWNPSRAIFASTLLVVGFIVAVYVYSMWRRASRYGLKEKLHSYKD